jgi:hypothetical protein
MLLLLVSSQITPQILVKFNHIMVALSIGICLHKSNESEFNNFNNLHTVSLHSNQMKMEQWTGTEAVVLVVISLVVYITNIVVEISFDLSRPKFQQDFIVDCPLFVRVSWKTWILFSQQASKEEEFVCYFYMIY